MASSRMLTIAAAVAALLLSGMWFGASLWVLAAYAGLLMIGGGLWLARNWQSAAIAVRHEGPGRVEIGQTIEVVIDVSNRGALPIAWVMVEDLLPRAAMAATPPSIEVEGERIGVFYLPRGEARQLRYRLTFRRRGYYQIGPTVLETGDLMGLSRRYRIGSLPQYVLVYPEQVPLAGYDIASPRPQGEIRIRDALVQDPTRIRGIRRWQVGDPLRSVHWAATARTGLLHSKVYEPTTMAGATLVLDLHRSTNPARHEPVRSDLAVTLACSIAGALYELNQPLGLLSNGRDTADRIRTDGFDTDHRTRDQARSLGAMRDEDDRLRPMLIPADRGPVHFEEVRRQLARIELSNGLDIGRTLIDNQPRLAHETTLILILPSCEPATAAMLVQMKRRGWVLSVIINTHDINDFAASAGALQADGIDTFHLADATRLPLATRRAIAR